MRLVTLDELLRVADFVSIHCPLNEQTLGIIGGRELSLMKPEAYLMTRRGPYRRRGRAFPGAAGSPNRGSGPRLLCAGTGEVAPSPG